MSTEGSKKNLSITLRTMLCGGLAGSIDELLTIPMDTAKVRMMMDKEMSLTVRNMFLTMKSMCIQEGPGCFYKGIIPGVHRQMVYASFRIGLFEPIRRFLFGVHKPGEHIGLHEKILAGMITGIIGITAANPTDVAKVRMQVQGMKGSPILYKDSLSLYSKVFRQEGLIDGFWLKSGWLPNCVRNCIINSAELATFFHTKQVLTERKIMGDTGLTDIVCGFTAGLVASICGNPIELIRTRLMSKEGKAEYGNAINCVKKVMLKEGPLGFYKGFPLLWFRLGTFNTLFFPIFVKLEKYIVPERH